MNSKLIINSLKTRINFNKNLINLAKSSISSGSISYPSLNIPKSNYVINNSNSRFYSTTKYASAKNIVPFNLADIGEGIAEVELIKWFVKKDQMVKSFDPICEVQSDKATVEITSRYDGKVVNVYGDEGSIVKVGSALIDIEIEGGDKVEGSSTPAVTEPVVNTPEVKESTFSRESAPVSTSKVLTTPAVRKFAKENKVDLTLVNATGVKGRISKEDVISYLNGDKNESSTTKVVTSVEDKVVPIRGVQRIMVKSMKAALEVQHLTYSDEIVVDELIAIRSLLKSDAEKMNIKLSFMPLIIKATSLALAQYPVLNTTVNKDCSEMTYHGNHNIGVAMDTSKGLIVPVIKGVQNMSIYEIAKELSVLQEAASKGTITEAQMQGGTFTLSNIGSIGGTYVVPVIVIPQTTIGAFGRQQILPRYVDDNGAPASAKAIHKGHASVKPVTIMNVSWSADHRVIDGATVARFSNLWKSYLEAPMKMLAEMK
jgi:2-oxoisovalerate dehydrogenase E2 component (dihydrolipoyl transacylase)